MPAGNPTGYPPGHPLNPISYLSQGLPASWWQSRKPTTRRRSGSGGGGGRPPAGKTVAEWVEEQVSKLINAEVDAINAQRAIYLEELERQAEIERERGRSLAAELRGLNFPAQIQGIYSNAASDIAGLAQGFAGTTRDVAAADAAEQASLVAGSGQEGAVRNEGVGMGDVIYGRDGFIPGRSFGEQGAALAAHAALEPSFAEQLGLVEAGRVKSEGKSMLADFARSIAEAQARRPSLEMDLREYRRGLENEAFDRKMDERAFRLSMLKEQHDQLKDERDWWVDQQRIALAQGNYQLAQRASSRAQQAENRRQQAEDRMANASRGLDVDGKPKPGYVRNPNTGAVEKAPPPPKGADWNEITEGVAEDAANLQEQGGWSKKKAANWLFNKYKGSLKSSASRAKLRKLIIKALNDLQFGSASEPVGGADPGDFG